MQILYYRKNVLFKQDTFLRSVSSLIKVFFSNEINSDPNNLERNRRNASNTDSKARTYRVDYKNKIRDREMINYKVVTKFSFDEIIQTLSLHFSDFLLRYHSIYIIYHGKCNLLIGTIVSFQ